MGGGASAAALASEQHNKYQTPNTKTSRQSVNESVSQFVRAAHAMCHTLRTCSVASTKTKTKQTSNRMESNRIESVHFIRRRKRRTAFTHTVQCRERRLNTRFDTASDACEHSTGRKPNAQRIGLCVLWWWQHYHTQRDIRRRPLIASGESHHFTSSERSNERCCKRRSLQ